MTNAATFTQENQLEERLTTHIATFWQTGNFASFQGIKNRRINYASFIKSHATQCLVISPGRSEGYLKYKELAFDLSQLNISIFIIDHRGQGLSERLLTNSHKGYVENFDDYADDLHTFINTIISPNCLPEKKPLLLAHSMGGAIATRLMQKYPNDLAAALISSPMIGIDTGGLPDWLAKTIINSGQFLNQLFANQAWYFIGQNDYQANEFENNALMQSQVRYQTFLDLYQEYPQLQLGGVTINWLKEALSAQNNIFAELAKISTPITIMQAGDDNVVDNQAQNDFCQQLHQLNASLCQQKRPYIIKGAKHELFFESDKYRNQALTYTFDWIKSHTD
ncbi:alpha/beta fold hydrolase [Colwelliaceae bacterium 6441]